MTARAALDRTILLTRDFVRPDEATDEEILQALLACEVSIVADAQNLRHVSGQTLLVSLATQLLQLGANVRLVVPEVPLVSPQPPLVGGELREALLSFAADLVPGVTASHGNAVPRGNLAFILGDTPWAGEAKGAWRLSGGRWWGSTSPVEETGSKWTETFPVGAMVAAAIAAAEPYKAAVRGLLERKGVARTHDELLPTLRARVVLEDETLLPQVRLGACDFVSGGAITNAALFTLYRVPGITGTIRLLEPDRLDISNLNRYPLARRRNVGDFKGDILASHAPPGVTLHAIHELFDSSNLSLLRPLAPTVAVGTDAIPPRWLAQSELPRWLGVGSTAHFMTLTSSHAPGSSCAACLHPRDDGVVATIPTISFVSSWAGLLLAARLLASAASGRVLERDAHILWPLRLDLPASQSWYRTPRAPDCPLGHGR